MKKIIQLFLLFFFVIAVGRTQTSNAYATVRWQAPITAWSALNMTNTIHTPTMTHIQGGVLLYWQKSPQCDAYNANILGHPEVNINNADPGITIENVWVLVRGINCDGRIGNELYVVEKIAPFEHKSQDGNKYHNFKEIKEVISCRFTYKIGDAHYEVDYNKEKGINKFEVNGMSISEYEESEKKKQQEALDKRNNINKDHKFNSAGGGARGEINPSLKPELLASNNDADMQKQIYQQQQNRDTILNTLKNLVNLFDQKTLKKQIEDNDVMPQREESGSKSSEAYENNNLTKIWESLENSSNANQKGNNQETIKTTVNLVANTLFSLLMSKNNKISDEEKSSKRLAKVYREYFQKMKRLGYEYDSLGQITSTPELRSKKKYLQEHSKEIEANTILAKRYLTKVIYSLEDLKKMANLIDREVAFEYINKNMWLYAKKPPSNTESSRIIEKLSLIDSVFTYTYRSVTPPDFFLNNSSWYISEPHSQQIDFNSEAVNDITISIDDEVSNDCILISLNMKDHNRIDFFLSIDCMKTEDVPYNIASALCTLLKRCNNRNFWEMNVTMPANINLRPLRLQ